MRSDFWGGVEAEELGFDAFEFALGDDIAGDLEVDGVGRGGVKWDELEFGKLESATATGDVTEEAELEDTVVAAEGWVERGTGAGCGEPAKGAGAVVADDHGLAEYGGADAVGGPEATVLGPVLEGVDVFLTHALDVLPAFVGVDVLV